jgi:hypothetical protein
VAEALSRVVPDADRHMILRIRHPLPPSLPLLCKTVSGTLPELVLRLEQVGNMLQTDAFEGFASRIARPGIAALQ